ncbi:MAG TPA: LysM peptidoglycan-binding domain-containing protein [Blastocatellia bacterium]|nr:LysM peptidoglycan-binding domain-containing protein [Blastocatellia bacterium]
MSATEKYQSVVDTANQQGIQNLSVQEQDGVLYLSGTAPSEEAKQKVWDAYTAIDPEMRGGDIVISLEVAGGGTYYTVQSGDSLSKIAKHYGINWQQIFEANRDQIKDPDKIFPGQKLRIPV